MSGTALQLEVVDNKNVVNTEQHGATESEEAPLQVSE